MSLNFSACRIWARLALALFPLGSFAATLYVDQNSSNPIVPYSSWASASPRIQDAIDAASAGDEVVVTNGLYISGGRVKDGMTTNRVVVDKALLLRSVNGPQFTFIEGYQMPQLTNGYAAVRCVYLGEGATLSGFTLTNGATVGGDFETGGGVLCDWRGAIVSNCVLTGNSASRGGGAAHGLLADCLLVRNTANDSGGASASTLVGCQVISNSAWNGGGVGSGVLSNCLLVANSAWDGGGALVATLNSCTILSNTATKGGGAWGGNLVNCVIAHNSAREGGGVNYSELVNCTLIENYATNQAGGAYASKLTNSIVWFNQAATNDNFDVYSVLTHCCLSSRPLIGQDNLLMDPLLMDVASLNLRLQSNSPCINAGDNSPVSSALDLDGRLRIVGGAVDLGAFEQQEPTLPTAPYIIAQPSPLFLPPGESGIFRVSAFGTYPLSYQWRLNGNDIVGATASTLSVQNVLASNVGAYDVVITNLAGEIASIPVELALVSGTLRFVDLNNANPVAPYTNWATAARIIQDAVDVSFRGDEIIVTNGVYRAGGRAVAGTSVNRVGVAKALKVRSVNGPYYTIIEGAPEDENSGKGQVRCVYLAEGASLTGFTLTNGMPARFGESYELARGGGVYCESTSVVVSNCVLVANSATEGGGAYSGTLVECEIRGNSTRIGGSGGGCENSNLRRCILVGNRAEDVGGGAKDCRLEACALFGNYAGYSGGGAYLCSATNCTITGNSAHWQAGGVSGGVLQNCIVYYNDSQQDANYTASWGSWLDSCCTTPIPTNSSHNLEKEPALASAVYLSMGSPCRGAGNPAGIAWVDIDGEQWDSPPSIGCDERSSEPLTGAVSVTISPAFTNAAVNFPLFLNGVIEGRVSDSVWDFGDGSTLSNRPYASHAWVLPGDYSVILRAYNETYPFGVTNTITIHVSGQAHYVDLNSPNPVPPYTSWSTAARSIQEAVDAAAAGNLVLVSQGLYSNSGRGSYDQGYNVVSVNKPIHLLSVNGPAVTTISAAGRSNTRCVYLTNGASISGFTLTGGNLKQQAGGVNGAGAFAESSALITNCIITDNHAFERGGGAYGGIVRGCTLSFNSAFLGGGAASSNLKGCTLTHNVGGEEGGGAFGATVDSCELTLNYAAWGGGAGDSFLTNCLITDNSAYLGGGAFCSTLNNCTLTGNSNTNGGGGGGVAGGPCPSKLNNCIIYDNAPGGNFTELDTLNYCCTFPYPNKGIGSITNAPLLVNPAAGNLHLQPQSPCINAGNNTYVAAPEDMDGNPRIIKGTVDIGAYEFPGATSTISYAWLQGFGLPVDGSVDEVDSDNDGMDNWHEWVCDTDPTDAASVLRMLPTQVIPSGILVRWQSVSTRKYVLEQTARLNQPTSTEILQTDIPGQNGVTSFAHTNLVGRSRSFYRVRVQEP